LGDERDELAADLAETRAQVDRLAAELDRLEVEKRSDGSEFGQIHEQIENLMHRLQSGGSDIFTMNDRIDLIDGGLDELRAAARALGQRVDEVNSRVARNEVERARVEERVEALSADLRSARREARDRDEAIVRRFDDAIAVVRSWADQYERRSVEHLRQIVSRLQDQLLELDAEGRDAAESR
jgi:chromosome segregation ATPase